MGELYAILALLLFAANMVMAKLASGRVGIHIGFMLSLGVNVAFGAAMVAAQLAMRPQPLAWHWAGFFIFALAGIFSTYLGRFFFWDAVVRFGPARASVFQATGPMFTVLIAWAVLGERLTALQYGGVALTIAGLGLVVYVPGVFAQGAASRAGHGGLVKWLASSILVVGLTSSLCYAIGNVLRGAAIQRWDEPLVGAFIAACSALVFQMATSRASWRIVRDVKAADRKGVLMFLFIGVLTICAQTSVFFAIRYTAVSIATLISSCAPVVVIPVSWWLLGSQDRITPQVMLGSVLALIGVALVLLG